MRVRAYARMRILHAKTTRPPRDYVRTSTLISALNVYTRSQPRFEEWLSGLLCMSPLEFSCLSRCFLWPLVQVCYNVADIDGMSEDNCIDLRMYKVNRGN